MASPLRTPRSIGFYLIALILLAVSPMLVISVLLTWRQGQVHREALESSLQQTAQALSVAVDRQLVSYRVMLESLAESQSLTERDFPRFQEYASRVAEKEGALFISLFDRKGKQLFNTLRTPGEALPTPYNDPAVDLQDVERPPIGDPTFLKLTFQQGKVFYSDLTYGLVAQRLIFLVDVPVIRNGRVEYVINAAFEPSVMTKLLQDSPTFRGLPAVIFDRKGFVVGRWMDAERYEGKRVLGFEDLRGKDSFVGAGTTFEGIKVLYAFARSPLTGWGVNVGPGREAFEGQVRTTWILGAALSVLGLFVGVLLAMTVAARLRHSMRQLADAAAHRVAPVSGAGLRAKEIIQVESALQDSEAVRDSEARERENRLVAEARRAEAEQANVAKDRFIALLSHELRNPLSPIRNAVDLLRATRTRADISVDNIIDILDRQSQQLTRLVNDLLDVSRISQGKVLLEKQDLDLRKVVAHALEAVRPALAKRRHRLHEELPGEPIHVEGDFARLSQIVSNLLDNAVKFTPSGGDITLSLRAERGDAVLRVKDNGIGIEPSLLGKIFTPFMQGERQRIQAGPTGLGLGLALSRSLAGLHDGTLDARSGGEGRGSELELRLPLSETKAAERASPDPLRLSSVNKRVLVVDDNVDAADTLKALLQNAGIDSRVVYDGDAALEVAQEWKPDVVLLDLGMPGADGFEVAARLRSLPLARRLVIVALTGWGQEADKHQTEAAGFDLHLVKPASLADVQAALSLSPPDRRG